MAQKVSLNVNGNTIELNPYIEDYFYYITEGVIKSLKDTEPIKTLDLDIDSDDLLTIILNGEGVSVNEFVMEIVRNTYAGMVSNLKGVDDEMRTLSISIEQ
jgi:hypothetical protein